MSWNVQIAGSQDMSWNAQMAGYSGNIMKFLEKLQNSSEFSKKTSNDENRIKNKIIFHRNGSLKKIKQNFQGEKDYN